MKLLTKIPAVALAFVLAGCGVESHTPAAPFKDTDKHLTCEQLMLEINDARFWQQQALDNKGLNFRNIIWPVDYPWTYNNAEEAIDSTGKRIQHLSNIYNIKGCNDPYRNTK